MKAYIQPSLSSTTFIHRDEILTFRFYILSAGEYSASLTIQLWNNLKEAGWNGINFTEKSDEVIYGCEQEKYRVFEVEVGTDVEEGWYEFTVRVHSSVWSNNEEWKWLSEGENQNGRIFIGRSKECMLNKVSISAKSWNLKGIESIFDENEFSHIEKLQTGNNTHADSWCTSMSMILSKEYFVYKNLGRPKEFVRYFGLKRMTNWWLVPTSGSDKLNISSKDVQYLIIQQASGHFVVLIPLTNENYYSSLNSNDSGELIIKCAINNSKCDKEVEVKLVISRGWDLSESVKTCMDAAKKITFWEDTKNEASRISSNGISYYDKLGYCTWNAFYDNVREDDLLRALRSLHNVGIQIGYIILDDGWQQINKNREMQGFEANLEKFPSGLKGLINKVKKEFPYVENFGVWHTLWGYWNGVDPSSFSTQYSIRKTLYQIVKTAHITLPKDICRFYNDFYSYLKEQGVNMVKVDFQACFDDIIEHDECKWWWVDYQKALTECSNKYFNQKIIYCMAHSPFVMQNTLSNKNLLSGDFKPLFRNSDDYYPDIEESHSWHIYTNLMNNLFTMHLYSIPEWDMCQSYHKYGEYHAAARTISGSPMYITDIPDHHNVEILKKCLVKTPKNTMQLLRCEQSAVPSGNTNDLFVDLTKVDKLLKILNMNGRIRVLGLWNCRDKDVIDHVNIRESLRFGKYSMKGSENVKEDIVIYFVKNKELVSLKKESINVMVRKQSFEIVLFIPVDILNLKNYCFKIACIGLIDKYNGSNAILSNEFKKIHNKAVYHVDLVGYGECGFYLWCDQGKVVNIRVYSDDEEVKDNNIKYEEERNMLIVHLENNGKKSEKDNIKLRIEINLD
ncbi:13990_t:CDS:2 [Funneliformis geosporum]|uniref:8665_t:CDS:1 n=1 Tax=Funneliformis geosporum TaxID=1117311 RepID=A0A9W4T1W6_9GLOM|nr:8665_t:CDS:2 [Funneliformis geosporum]CAI2189790.1 13990_t:CDS:2 [Funneliformis geosporum]